jgi:pSer/pThr/pTyr-binding forkhead associated (FHA) protein
MIQLKISSGKMAGVSHDVRHFPFHVGRAATADLRLEDDGVWDNHLVFEYDPAQGFIITAQGSALATVNGWPIQSVLLRNGDTIEIGSARLRFWIGEVKQSRLRFHEFLVWASLVAVTTAEVLLLLWLLK